MIPSIQFHSSTPAGLRAHVAAWCRTELGEQVTVEPADQHRVDLGLLTGFVSALIAAVALIIQVQGERRWTAEKLISATKDALLKHKVVECEVRRVEGFETLTSSAGCCYLEAVDKRTGDTYRVEIRRNGDSHVIRLVDDET